MKKKKRQENAIHDEKKSKLIETDQNQRTAITICGLYSKR